MRQYGRRFKKGLNCIIEPEVTIGDNVTLGHNVILRDGTIIGNDVALSDNVCTTGLCYIGNHAIIRAGSIISRGVIIEDFAFIGAGVVTSSMKRVFYHRPKIEGRILITKIGYGAIIGSKCCLSAGIIVGNNATIGYASFVNKDIADNCLAYGSPIKEVSILYEEERVEIDSGWKEFNFDVSSLMHYLPLAQ